MGDILKSWDDMQQLKNRAIKQIAEQREEIIRAFMAKYLCGPEDVEQIVTFEGTQIRWYVQWRKGREE